MNTVLTRQIAACMLAMSMQFAWAAGSEPAAAPDVLSTARAKITSGKWAEAIEELKRVNDTSSADWHNLMGYSLRKSVKPDLEGSEQHYNEALRINPKHRGALEYSGELYLTKGDLASAEKRLAALDKECTLPCKEYRTLKKAVDSYKSSGQTNSDGY